MAINDDGHGSRLSDGWQEIRVPGTGAGLLRGWRTAGAGTFPQPAGFPITRKEHQGLVLMHSLVFEG